MKLKILTLILFIAVVIFIAIQEPIAAAIFAGIIIFLVVANSIDESKSTITQLENSIAEDKELFNELLVKNEELEKKIAKHKQNIKVAESIAHASIDAGHCLMEERNCLKRDIVNLNATIKELSTTIDSMKAKKS